ncbi:MAG: TPM domain-containing protein [Paludibacteraceae bacterium]|nr:TPM domain-containing protein [Paludibacteraceae bacterium]
MNTFIRKTLLLLFIACSALVYAGEYTPSTVPNPKLAGQEFYVSNPDSIMTENDVNNFNYLARELEDSTKVELCAVALESIGEMDCFDFAYELFQRWGIGGKNKNTGVLILFVLDSHDIRIMTGTGIEGVLTDAICANIIQKYMVPCFRSGLYGSGICMGGLAIYEECTGGEAPEELVNMVSVTNRGQYASDEENDSEGFGVEGWIIVGMVAFCIFLAVWKPRVKCPNCKKRKGKLTKTQVERAATYAHGGNGIHFYKCQECGHEWSAPYTTARLTRSSGSSSRGGGGGGHSGGSWGGGSTSGGGAGGKW